MDSAEERRKYARESAARQESAKQSPLRSSGAGGWSSGIVRIKPGPDPTYDDTGGAVRGGAKDTGTAPIEYETGPDGTLQRKK